MSKLKTYTILYRDKSLLPADAPLAFTCDAEEPSHAEEQLHNYEPDAEVVWLDIGGVNSCYSSYYKEDF